MANKKSIKKDNVKKIEKKYVKDESEDIKKFIKIVVILAVVFGFMYLLTVFLNNKGMFNKKIERQSPASAVIDYEEILLGSVFNINEKEYYVVFDTFNDNANIYLNNIMSSYKGNINIYKVDMSKKFNSAYLNETGNKNATNSSELSINGVTLIKIVNEKINKYFEGTEAIASELK